MAGFGATKGSSGWNHGDEMTIDVLEEADGHVRAHGGTGFGAIATIDDATKRCSPGQAS
jgi:hypothetical protein